MLQLHTRSPVCQAVQKQWSTCNVQSLRKLLWQDREHVRTSTCDGASKIRRRGSRATSQSRPGLMQASSHSIAPGSAQSALAVLPAPSDACCQFPTIIGSWQIAVNREDPVVTRCASPSHSLRLPEKVHKELASVAPSLSVHKLHRLPQSSMHSATAVPLTFGLNSEGSS